MTKSNVYSQRNDQGLLRVWGAEISYPAMDEFPLPGISQACIENRAKVHENSEGLFSTTIPNLRGYHPIACSGKPNPSD